jgi:hypothetical protein
MGLHISKDFDACSLHLVPKYRSMQEDRAAFVAQNVMSTYSYTYS